MRNISQRFILQILPEDEPIYTREGGDWKEVHGLLILFLHYELQPERLKFIRLSNQHGERNCPKLNNPGHVEAAELLCRLQGWTV